MVTVLGPFIENDINSFRCPDDTQYFNVEGLSYEYRAMAANLAQVDLIHAFRRSTEGVDKVNLGQVGGHEPPVFVTQPLDVEILGISPDSGSC